MTGTGENTEGAAAAEQALPWLLRQKIGVPERAAGYFHRVALVELALPTRRCVTVLMAPGGFGKTTLLAECCRRLAGDGVPTAWVSLDEQDEPGVLDSGIAFACQGAGLDIADGPEPDEAGRGPESRAGFVLQAIAALGRPFVLAFDELERLANPASVALLDFLLQRAPGNLHLALACRHLPVGLNIAGAVLEGRAAVLTTDQLQFSRTEVAEFFERRLSGSELDRLVAESAGWPFALRIARNGIQGGIGSNAGRCGTWSRTGWNRVCSRGSGGTTGNSCSISACSTGSMRRFSTRCWSATIRSAGSTRCRSWSGCSSRWAAGRRKAGVCIRWFASIAPGGGSARRRSATARSIGGWPRRWCGAARRWPGCAMPSKPGSRALPAAFWRMPAGRACGSARGRSSSRPRTAC